MIFLHGSGERGDDNEAQLKWGVQNFATNSVMKNHRPIVIAPQCPENERWDSYTYKNEMATLTKKPNKNMSLLKGLIDKAIAEWPIDPNRIYITGMSMGGFGTFAVISRYPELFAAAVPVCGGGDLSKVSNFSHIPISIFHGALDVTVPFFSIQMLEAPQNQAQPLAIPNIPMWTLFLVAAYDDDTMMAWLFKQKKKRSDQRVFSNFSGCSS